MTRGAEPLVPAPTRSCSQLWRLRLEGRALATMLLLETDGVLYYLKGGYDPAFERCSPGMVLLASVIEHAFVTGTRRVELLGGDERYKLAFTSDVRDKRRFQAFAPSVPGLVSMAAFRYGRPVARRALEVARRPVAPSTENT